VIEMLLIVVLACYVVLCALGWRMAYLEYCWAMEGWERAAAYADMYKEEHQYLSNEVGKLAAQFRAGRVTK